MSLWDRALDDPNVIDRVRVEVVVTAQSSGPRLHQARDDLLTSDEVRLSDDKLDRTAEIVPPDAEVGASDRSPIFPADLACPGSAAGQTTRAPAAEPPNCSCGMP